MQGMASSTPLTTDARATVPLLIRIGEYSGPVHFFKKLIQCHFAERTCTDAFTKFLC